MTATHYRLTEEGGWFALVHDGRALLVEAGAERAAQLWPGLVEGADALLDLLTASGLSSAPSFALVEADAEGGLRTILRGPVAATVTAGGADAERSGAGVATWREDADATAAAVRLRVTAADAGGGPELPIVSGVVATAELRLDLRAEGVAAPSVALASSVAPPAPAPAPAPVPAAPQPFTVPPFTPGPAAAAAPAAPSVPTPVDPDDEQPDEPAALVDDAIDERTSVLPPRRPAEAPEQTVLPEQTILPLPDAATADPVEPAADAADGADEYDYLFGSTVVRPVADAAVRDEEDDEEAETPDPGALAVPAEGDHDGHTVMASDLAELRARRRESGGGAAPAAPAPTLQLLRHDGVVEALDQPVLVGRAPSVSQVSGGRMPRLVTVSSLGQDISRNHVQFSVEGGTVVVTDLHSRNGTHVVLPGKSPQKLRQGEPTTVIVGTVVDLGGGVTFTVSEG